jgi:hypothetical protein
MSTWLHLHPKGNGCDVTGRDVVALRPAAQLGSAFALASSRSLCYSTLGIEMGDERDAPPRARRPSIPCPAAFVSPPPFLSPMITRPPIEENNQSRTTRTNDASSIADSTARISRPHAAQHIWICLVIA